jgi:pimeloyl-ACP methyl ester carboxylesterase
VITRTTGRGRPIVAVHGFGIDHRILLPLEHAVTDAPWRWVHLDLPWVRESPGYDPSVASAQQVADAVREAIRAHLGDEPFAIVGNSFGGMIARSVAHELRDQVLGLATIVGVVEPDHARRRVPPRQVVLGDPDVVASAEPGPARDDFAALSVVQTAATLDAHERYVLPGVRAADQTVVDRIATDYALGAEPEARHPAPFTAPSLHLFGRQDDVVGYEDGLALRDHYPRGTYAVLDAAGHNAHLERPAVATALFRDWLDRMSWTAGPRPAAED